MSLSLSDFYSARSQSSPPAVHKFGINDILNRHSMPDGNKNRNVTQKRRQSVSPNYKESIERLHKKCPKGKQWKESTRRCIKKCKQGFTRNNKFKCVKQKHLVSQSKIKDNGACPSHKEMICVKKCPDNHVRNPNTGLCNKSCKHNQVRNKKFKCVKNWDE